MITSPTTPPQPNPTEAPTITTPTNAKRPSRFGFFFGLAATALTLGAIALAVFAPQLSSAPTLQIPQGWQQVYNDNPGASPSAWENTGGCSFGASGVDITSEGTCEFKPANGASLADGVLVVAQLGPAANVSRSQDAGILLDNSVLVIITQQGDYKICRSTCDALEAAQNHEAPVISGSTVAWHADAFVTNEIAVLYSPDAGTLNFYANGQFITQASVGIVTTPSIALTTSTDGEALFTHVAIYAGRLG